MELRIREQICNEPARGSHHAVIGVPKLRQTAQVLGLICAGSFQEDLETRTVGSLGGILRHDDRRVENVCDECLDKSFF